MWCSICRQDVPGLIVPGGGQYCCPRCGEMMPSSIGTPESSPRDTEETNDSNPNPAPVTDYDEWEMEERLRHLDRIYARSPLKGPLSLSDSSYFRVDSQHAPVPREQPVAPPQPAQTAPSLLARLGRLALGFGLSVTVCGGCLMIWAHYGARPDLMPLGIPIAVVGQIFLLFGLVLQFDSPARESSQTPKPSQNQPTLPLGNSIYRFDNAPSSSPDLTDLAARLDELSRRLDNHDEGQR